MLVQRDFGRRDDRKWARLKYTVERMTADGFLAKLNEYLGYELEPVRDFQFESNGDKFGWVQDDKGNHHLTLFVPGGRVLDTPSCPMKSGLVEIAKVLQGEFRMTANQNLVISNITDSQKPEIEALLEQYKILKTYDRTALRLNSIACVALPTCGLSLAEAERYLSLIHI